MVSGVGLGAGGGNLPFEPGGAEAAGPWSIEEAWTPQVKPEGPLRNMPVLRVFFSVISFNPNNAVKEGY